MLKIFRRIWSWINPPETKLLLSPFDLKKVWNTYVLGQTPDPTETLIKRRAEMLEQMGGDALSAYIDTDVIKKLVYMGDIYAARDLMQMQIRLVGTRPDIDPEFLKELMVKFLEPQLTSGVCTDRWAMLKRMTVDAGIHISKSKRPKHEVI